MTLIKTSILSAVSTIIRVVTGFIVVKVVSVYIGPSGLALVAQVQNFINMASSVASGGITTGIVKYTAEYREDIKYKKKLWSTSLKFSLILSFSVAIIVALFSKYLSQKLLGSTEFQYVFLLFSATVVLFVLNGILNAILNGQGEIKKLTVLNITGSILSLIVAVLLVVNYHLKGAMIYLIVTQSIVFFVSIFFVIKSNWFKIEMFIDKLDKENVINLLKFSLMTLTATISNMSALIFLRNYIGTNLGWDAAGYWQGVWRISETYLMLITTTLSIYYLPKLSSIQDKEELKREILHGYKVLMPLVILMAISIYIFRDLIIKIVFTEEFSPMSDLFLFQLIGDVFKIASWLISFTMLAKAMLKLLVATQIIFLSNFVLLGVIFLNLFNLIGVTIAFMVNYMLYFIAMILLFKKKFYIKGNTS